MLWRPYCDIEYEAELKALSHEVTMPIFPAFNSRHDSSSVRYVPMHFPEIIIWQRPDLLNIFSTDVVNQNMHSKSGHPNSSLQIPGIVSVVHVATNSTRR